MEASNVPTCHCGKKAQKRVSNTETNPNRIFYVCSKVCNFFIWEDQFLKGQMKKEQMKKEEPIVLSLPIWPQEKFLIVQLKNYQDNVETSEFVRIGQEISPKYSTTKPEGNQHLIKLNNGKIIETHQLNNCDEQSTDLVGEYIQLTEELDLHILTYKGLLPKNTLNQLLQERDEEAEQTYKLLIQIHPSKYTSKETEFLSNYNRAVFPAQKLCCCGRGSKRSIVSKEGPTKGNYFFGCGFKVCTFFEWEDKKMEQFISATSNIKRKTASVKDWKVIKELGMQAELVDMLEKESCNKKMKI